MCTQVSAAERNTEQVLSTGQLTGVTGVMLSDAAAGGLPSRLPFAVRPERHQAHTGPLRPPLRTPPLTSSTATLCPLFQGFPTLALHMSALPKLSKTLLCLRSSEEPSRKRRGENFKSSAWPQQPLRGPPPPCPAVSVTPAQGATRNSLIRHVLLHLRVPAISLECSVLGAGASQPNGSLPRETSCLVPAPLTSPSPALRPDTGAAS